MASKKFWLCVGIFVGTWILMFDEKISEKIYENVSFYIILFYIIGNVAVKKLPDGLGGLLGKQKESKAP